MALDYKNRELPADFKPKNSMLHSVYDIDSIVKTDGSNHKLLSHWAIQHSINNPKKYFESSFSSHTFNYKSQCIYEPEFKKIMVYVENSYDN